MKRDENPKIIFFLRNECTGDYSDIDALIIFFLHFFTRFFLFHKNEKKMKKVYGDALNFQIEIL